MEPQTVAPQSVNQQPASPTPDAQASQPTPSVPTEWPGAFGAYKYAKAIVKFNWVPYLVTFVIAFIFSGAVQQFTAQSDSLSIGGSVVQIVVESLFSAAGILILFASLDGTKLSFGSSVQQGLKFWIRYILALLLVYVLLVLSLLLLIVPFFFVAPRLVLVPYLIVRRNLGVVDALQASWDNTKGHVGKVYGIVGATIVYALLLITIIGIPFAVYLLFMYSAAWVLLCEFILKQQPAAAPVAAPQTTAQSQPVSPTPPVSTPPVA